MMRTRLLWFTLGFSSAGAAVSHFVLRDLWIERQVLSSQLKQKFDALENRVSNLEPGLRDNSNSLQGEGNLN
ncbi:uncharacterized protein LOC131150954 isoform X2 [Malania oleifera]|uniref:uncharacterized protein LOC131150954 isoform X2 n=1 Tax=Malania oleifera TaxID=397392 RepID=UPI0025AE3332|nr:uncharacterized protein LOC131150954 isoform X2 [Malania oleifera]